MNEIKHTQCTMFIKKGVLQIPVLTTFCFQQQPISYMEIYLKWIFPIVFNSVTSMFCFVILLPFLCSDNKSLYRTGKASGSVFVKRIIPH